MSSGLRLQLEAFGNETGEVPVKVEILDRNLRPIEQRWLMAKESREFRLEPGIYGVRASVSSGAAFEQAVRVRPGEMEDCRVPLHSVSPHESHEWAYLTQPIDAPGRGLLCDGPYEGVWMRLWQGEASGGWSVLPLPIRDGSQVSWDEEGVSYSFRAQEERLHAVQLGGPKVRWKIAALPPSYRVMLLVRPASAPGGGVHPLDVVISSDDWKIEALLALMQRGDTAKARDLDNRLRVAEELLYGKVRNTAAAAVGGYFLLRLGDLERLHDWANNLANWFEWMADGPVIHAWQLIAEGRRDPTQKGARLEQARVRLLEAVRRGFPLYTEGLRLLRDGLLLFDRRAKGEDKEIHGALGRVGEYAAVADWSATTTTFNGDHPNNPSTDSRRGEPRDRGPLIYVFDVPLREALRRRVLKAGEQLIADLPKGTWQCTVGERGTLDLPDGRSFKGLGAMHSALTGQASGAWAWGSWRVASTGQFLSTVVEALRTESER